MKKLFLITMIVLFTVSLFAQADPYMTQYYVGAMQSAGLVTSDFQGLKLPYIRGTWYFVDPTGGTYGKEATAISSATTNIVDAYNKCTDGAGDGIVLLSRGSTSSATTSYLSSALTWSKSGITTIGICAPTFYNQRARVADSSGIDGLPYLIKVSGANNAFINMMFVNTPNDSDNSAQYGAVQFTGVRNVCINCDFKAYGNTASAYRSDLWLSGADETAFINCNFGNASSDIGNNAACHIYADGTTGNGQILFDHCTSIAQVSTGTAFGCVKSGAATSLNGTWIFRDCIFVVWQANTGLTAMASWFIGTKPTTGNYVVGPTCMAAGYATWDATGGNDRVIIPVGITDGDLDPNIGGTP